MDDLLTLLPTSRRTWGWAIIVTGLVLGALVWFTGAGQPAVGVSSAGYLVAAGLGVATLGGRRHGVWWAVLALLVGAAATAAFAVLR